MQQVIVVEFEESTDNEKVIAELRTDAKIKKLEIFNTPLDALVKDGSTAVNNTKRLIRFFIERLDDEELLDEIAKDAIKKMFDNYDPSDADAVIPSILEVFKERFDSLDNHDREIALSFIEMYSPILAGHLRTRKN